MSEHALQSAFFQVAQMHVSQWPELELLYAIPNGGQRDVRVAVKLKAEGVKAGVLDVHLPVARGGYIGLWIEFKYGRNKPSEKQVKFTKALQTAGHYVLVAYDWAVAWEAVKLYLAGRIIKEAK